MSPSSSSSSSPSYHRRMIHHTLHANTVIVLPPSAGKTLIAAQVILSLGTPALFLVPTCYLVSKQEAILKQATTLNVRPYQGGAILPDAFDVLVSTPKAFEVAQMQTSRNPHLAWRTFKLVVFDEVHHVLKDHPYRKLALGLRADPAMPRILGLTAAYVTCIDDEKVQDALHSICYDLEIKKVMTASENELSHFGPQGADLVTSIVTDVAITKHVPFGVLPIQSRKPHMMLRTFFARVLNSQSTTFADLLARCVLKMELTLTDLNPHFVPPIQSNLSLKQWSNVAHRFSNLPGLNTDVAYMSAQLEFWYEALRLLIVTWEEDQFASVLLLRMAKCHLPRGRAIWPAPVADSITTFWGFVPKRFEKLEELKRVLMMKKRGLTSFKGLLFVQQRISTHVLQFFITSDSVLKEFFTTACLYATSSPASPSLSVSKLQAKQNLEKFEKGTVNLLIATVVAEESMDIPKANCVIRFDDTQNTPFSQQKPPQTPPLASPSDHHLQLQVLPRQNRLRTPNHSLQHSLHHSRQQSTAQFQFQHNENSPFLLLPASEQKKPSSSRPPFQKLLPSATHPSPQSSLEQTRRETAATRYLVSHSDVSNCLVNLRAFCHITKTPLETQLHYHDNHFFVVLKYSSCLRTLSAKARAANRNVATVNAALHMLFQLRAQVVGRASACK